MIKIINSYINTSLLVFSLAFFVFVPISAEAKNSEPYNFEISNVTQNGDECVATISMMGINTKSVAHVILDGEVVWSTLDISDFRKTHVFEEELLSFGNIPCVTESIHDVKAVLKNGFIASQNIKVTFNEVSPKAWAGYGIKKAVLWIAKNAKSPIVIDFIEVYGGKAAANAWRRKAPELAAGLRNLSTWSNLSIEIVRDQVVGGLMRIGVSRAVATNIGVALKIGLEFILF
ncbi:MAG: hypothetical protein V3U87_10885 [Methylococcaceae bacterium]